MFKAAKGFIADEFGAVTVDWVVITASIAFLGVVVVTTVGDGMEEPAEDVGEFMENYTPWTDTLW